MLKRKTLLSCVHAPFEFISHSLAGSKLTFLLFAMLLFSSMAVRAQEVSLAFKVGFLGTQGNNSNSTTGNLTFSTLGISKISFSQNDSDGDGKFGGTQGNDLEGIIKIYLNSGQIITLNGALNFRNSGNSRDIFGFIFASGQNTSFTYGGSNTYNIVTGNIASTTTSLGVRAYSSNYSISSTFSGNASTSGLLDELNLELANSPQPSNISNPTVVEGNNLVYSVTLSSATSANNPQVYTFTQEGTATSSGDYTPTFTFSNGVTDNGDGSITVPGGVSSFTITASTIDDITPEPTETLILNLGSKQGTGSITDNDVSLSTSVASLTAFSTCTSTASSAQSFTFSGNIYSGTVTVTAPTGFEISQTQNGTYSSSIAYSFSGTSVTATTVWVRSKSTTTNGLSGNVTVATAGGTTQNVSVSVTVNAIPTISISPSSATIALGGSVTLTASGGSTYSWSPSTNLSASNTVSVTASPSSTISYTVTGTSAAGCSSTASVTVTVNPALTAGSIVASQTICVGATPAALTSSSAASGGVGTINYQWETSTDNSTWSNVVNATSATYSPGAISVNTYFRRKASTSTDAPVYTSAVLITVQQSVGGSISGSATVCSGTNSTVLTLSGQTGSITKWQSSLYSNFSSVTDIVSSNASITATNLTATAYYRAVVTLGSCTSANSSVASVTVNALPTITVNVIPDVTTSATSFTIPYTNLSSGADKYSLSTGTIAMPGFTSVNNASITASPLTISIPASTQNSYDFNLTILNNTTGCSTQRGFNLVVTDINPGTTGSDQSICYGTTPAPFTSNSAASGGGGSPTYIWQISTSGITGTYTDIAGATAATYTHPTALTGDTYFRRKATIGASVATAHPIEVLVNALPVISVSPSSASITTGSSVSLTASGADTYSWTPSTGLSATNIAVVTASPTVTTTYTVTGTNSTTTCSSSASVTVTVNAALAAGSISADQTICVGATPAALTSSSNATGGTGPISYVWQSSTDGTIYNTISGATSSTYSPGAISVNTYFKRGASTPVDAVVYSSPVLITVQQSVGGSIAGSASVCTGTNSTVLTLSGQTGSVTKWQSSLTSNFSSVTDIANTTASITATNLTATTYYRAVITLGSCTSVNSSIATVTVNALPVISVSPSVPSIANGSSVTLTASGSNTYSWTPSTGLSATNTAVVTASPTVTTTYTITGTSNTSCSTTTSVTVTVTSAAPADSDGDGVTDTQEIADGTDPNDGCSYLAASKTLTPSSAWNALDCDGDGTPNGTDTDPKDPCVHAAGATPVYTNAIWRAADCDGDGVTNGKEKDDNTDPNDGCSYLASSKTLTPSAAWNALDCDGDGTPNGTDTDPKDPCVHAAGATPVYTNAIWRAADCDGDGVTNGKEKDDNTDPNDGCSYLAASKTLTPSAAWNAIDCDGDGTPNGTDTDPKDPCVHAAGATPVTTNAIWRAADCDGDGVTNGKEKDDNTDPNDGCSYLAASKTLTPSTAWNALDCDGDGTPNGTDTDPKDPCVHAAGATPVYTNAIWRAADCDGDGVTNGKEKDDNTDPNDGCSYLAASKTLTPSSAWNALDCDGDGTPNGTDADPKDPCVHAAGATPVTTNAIWRAADCDGDGVTNGKETDDNTDPNNGCSFVAASKTLTPTSNWGALDCDGDGNPNATDPNKDTPVASNDAVTVGNSGKATINLLSNDDFLPGANTEMVRQAPPNDGTAKGTVTFNPLTGEMTYKRAPFESGLVTMGYKVTNKAVTPPVSATAFVTIVACDLQDPLADCDGDGDPNGTDTAPTDPCVYSTTLQVKANVSDDWKALDCDGDGVINGTELTDGTSPADGCSFKAPSITLSPSAAWLVLDCDADGITNKVEGTQDFDGDGIPNCLDTDSDGDSISDKLETTVDTDKDGKPDYLDLDSDNDGILDSVENKVCTGTGILCDTDADGKPNFRDLDSDADQISDVIEANGSDYNRDGIADGNIDEKGIPTSANKGLTPPDTDRDGKLDPYDVDSDGDGILDYDEEYNEDADFPDCDKDGIINRLDPDECDIFSPQGISPNGDGKNDRLVFKGLFLRKIPNRLSIYNRWGTLVFEMESYDNTFTGTSLPDGTYYYILDFFGKKPTISNYLSVDRTIK